MFTLTSTRLKPEDSKLEIGGALRIYLLGLRLQLTAWDYKWTLKLGKDILHG